MSLTPSQVHNPGSSLTWAMTFVDCLYFRTKLNPNLSPNTSQVSEKKIVLVNATHQKRKDGNRQLQSYSERTSDRAANDYRAFARSVRFPGAGDATG